MTRPADAPAFPCPEKMHGYRSPFHTDGRQVPYVGMTLRQYAAIAAMQGLVGIYGTRNHAETARDCVDMADALLAALEPQK